MVAFFPERRSTASDAADRDTPTPGAGGRRSGSLKATLALGLVFGLAGAGFSSAARARYGPVAGPEALPAGPGLPAGRPALRLQAAQAWSRLDDRQRRALFATLRTLESRDATARLELLAEMERCLQRARGVAAIQACQEQEHGRRRALKQAHQASIGALMRSYGLPLAPHPRRMGWRQGHQGQRDQLRQGYPEAPRR